MLTLNLFRKITLLTLTLSLTYILSDCQKDAKNKNTAPAKTVSEHVTKRAPKPAPAPTTQKPVIKSPEKPQLPTTTVKTMTAKTVKPVTAKPQHAKKETAAAKPKTETLPSKYKIYSNLQKILNALKTGQSATKEELIATKAVPEDAMQVVRCVRKVSDHELQVQWKSKWLLESVSDVKLNDDRIKVRFSNNAVYTSGPAIGIEYEDKIYNELIIKGDRAYIPSVKEYSWRIGR